MLNEVKVLLAGEKIVRKMNQKINETFIDQLTREDLTLKEKLEIAEQAKEIAADNVKTEEKNSEFWYKYGKNEGEIKGMMKAIGALAAGLAIGTFLRKR